MSITLGDRVLDVGLTSLDTECDKIHVCSSTPTDYADTLTKTLGNKNFGAGNAFGSPAAGSPDGRKVTSVAITDGSVTASGTVACWAAVDSANSRLLATGSLSGGMAVTSGWVFTLDAFGIHLPITAGGVYVGPGDIQTTGWEGWWGPRAFSLAAIGSNALTLLRNDSVSLDVATVAGGGLDTAIIAWLSGHTATVSRFYDQSGKGTNWDFIPSVDLGGTAAAFSLDGSNLPVITFNHAANNCYQSAGAVATRNDLTQPWSLVAFAKRTAIGDYDGLITTGSPAVGMNYDIAGNLIGFGAGNFVTKAATDNAKHFVGMVANGASGKTCVDGTVATSQNLGTGSWTGSSFTLYLGNDVNNGRALSGIFYGGGVNSLGISDANLTALSSQDFAYWGS